MVSPLQYGKKKGHEYYLHSVRTSDRKCRILCPFFPLFVRTKCRNVIEIPRVLSAAIRIACVLGACFVRLRDIARAIIRYCSVRRKHVDTLFIQVVDCLLMQYIIYIIYDIASIFQCMIGGRRGSKCAQCANIILSELHVLRT